MPERRARRRLVWAALACIVVAGAAVAVRLLTRPRIPRVAPAPAQVGDENVVEWHPRPEGVPDGGCPPPVDDLSPSDGSRPTRFAAIGDYGYAGPEEEAVADMVKAARPEFVITLGDNNYPLGAAESIDLNIGLFYHEYIAPYVGRFGCGAARNRFFPALGNHDWMTPGARPYLDYFALPGNERYYEVTWGQVGLFALDSDPNEPDGITADSAQGRWLQGALAASKARWKIVYMHHAPYSSGPHGSTMALRWPYKAWGADLVLAGHDHTYERFDINGLTYVVNGMGGAVFYPLGKPVRGSVVRFNENTGAIFFEADAATLRVRFRTTNGREVDGFTLTKQ